MFDYPSSAETAGCLIIAALIVVAVVLGAGWLILWLFGTPAGWYVIGTLIVTLVIVAIVLINFGSRQQ